VVLALITFAFVLIFTMLTLLIGVIDIIFFHKSVQEFLHQVLSIQFGTRKWWVFTGILVGFIYSVLADYKQFKAKKGVSEET
jgi:hypothetical protein